MEETQKVDFYEFTKKGYMFSLDIPKSQLEDKSFSKIVEEKIKEDNADKYVIKRVYFSLQQYTKEQKKNSNKFFFCLLELELDNNNAYNKEYTFYNSLPFLIDSNNHVYFFSNNDDKNNQKNNTNHKVIFFAFVFSIGLTYLIHKLKPIFEEEVFE